MKNLSLLGHFVLLLCFALCMMVVWMAPLLLAGFPYQLPINLAEVKQFTSTGILQNRVVPLFTLYLWLFHHLIPWENVVAWVAVGTLAMSASLFPLWWAARSLFGAGIAWLTVIIFSFMPLFWVEAVYGGEYPPAFFFLFLSFALFLSLYERHRVLMAVLCGLSMGAALSCSHAFFALLPWPVVFYLWSRRRQWKWGIVEIGIFSLSLFIAYTLPLLPNAMQPGLTPVQRVEQLLFSPENHKSDTGHLYPDNYTYEFLRSEFEKQSIKQNAEAPFLTRLQERYSLIIFGVGDTSLYVLITNGLWLFLNTLPQLFLQDYVGGPFLWLFIIPGIVVLWGQRRRLLIGVVGLWLSMEFILRFILHFGRSHLMDWGWFLPMFAAVGVVWVSGALSQRWRRIPVAAFSAAIVLIMVGQLLQSNRHQFARFYSRSTTPVIYSASEALSAIPPDAVVASPGNVDLFYFSDRKHVQIAPYTIQYLSEKRRLSEPFTHYGVTHIIGYDDAITDLVVRSVPGIRMITLPEAKTPVPVTPLIGYLLNIIR